MRDDDDVERFFEELERVGGVKLDAEARERIIRIAHFFQQGVDPTETPRQEMFGYLRRRKEKFKGTFRRLRLIARSCRDLRLALSSRPGDDSETWHLHWLIFVGARGKGLFEETRRSESEVMALLEGIERNALKALAPYPRGRRPDKAFLALLRLSRGIWRRAGGKGVGAYWDHYESAPKGPFFAFFWMILEGSGGRFSPAAVLKAIQREADRGYRVRRGT